MSESQHCFIPDSKEVYVIAKIIEYLDSTNQVVVKDLKNNRNVTLKKNEITLIGSMEELDNPPSDLIKLVHVNRPGILHTLRTRFMNDQIYTSIGPILVALNPFKWITNLYDDDIKEKYNKEERFLTDSPHVFAIAHEAFRELHLGMNQSLIISGESGAGKTEATKQCLNYLAYSAGSSSGIQAKILKASPVLEGWGNAKTLRNNNSSRFGKFIEIWFDNEHMITGASNTTYILEKSRVVYQEKDERNYHIFYQLLKGADSKLLHDLELEEFALNPEKLFYINQSGCINIEDVDDAQDFNEANQALIDMGFTPEEQVSLYAIIAGILLLGNVSFDPHPTNSEESIIAPESREYLEKAVRRFGVDRDLLERGLLFKQIKSGGGKRGSLTLASFTPIAAIENKNALVKETYKRCFDWIVAKINALMKNSDVEAMTMIGILDIFGFEIFQKNSFEQLCINLANEALQQHFNYNIFQAELDVYRQEDVPLPPLEYRDNQDVLDMIMKKPKGLIPILDEEGIVPRGSWEGFISKFSKQHNTNPRYKKTRNPHDLGIVHYAGEVIYDPSLFLIKNKDTLSADLIEVFSSSTQSLLHDLYDEELLAKLNASASGLSDNDGNSTQSAGKTSSMFSFGSTANTPTKSGAESKMTVGRKFSLQLDKLIAKLNSTKPRYIRCIKPNQAKKSLLFISDLTNEQLTYSGVFEAVIIMQNGYPFRMPLLEFRKKYHMLLCSTDTRVLLFEDELAKQYSNGSLSLDKIPIKQIPQKGLVRKFSREQCVLMIQLLSEYAENEVHQKELQKCFAGHTRVFYQARQHNILEKWSIQMSMNASIKIQSYARSMICRNLIPAIQKDDIICSTAILNRDMPILKSASKRLEILLERLNKVFPYLAFTLDIAEIGVKYSEAIELETHCTREIKILLDDTRAPMVKYDALEGLLKQATSINFSAMYRGTKLTVDWEKNPDLVAYSKTIEHIGIPVLIQRKFNEGIQNQDDDLLKIAIKDLEKAKTIPGVVLPTNFCVEEVVSANQIVMYAEQLYSTFISKVVQAVKVGNLSSHRKEGSFDLEIIVNSNTLSNLLKEYSSNNNKKISTKKIKLTLSMCSILCDLRVSAEEKNWEDVWANIQTHWKEYVSIISNLQKNTTTTNDKENNDVQLSSILVPGGVTKLVYEEIRAASIIAINYFFVPQLEISLKSNGVPDIPVWDSTPSSSSTGSSINPNHDLINQIAASESYVEYFDETLNAVLLRAKEHLFVREAIFSLDVTRITVLSKQLKLIPTTNSDYINAIKYEQMFNMIADLQVEILENKVISTPTPGKIDFTKIDINRLNTFIKWINNFIAKGNLWKFLIQLSKEVHSIRTMFKEYTYDEDSYLKLKDNLDCLSKDVLSNDSILETYPISKQLLDSVIEELAHYRVEILHSIGIKAITSALAIGAVSKDVNDKSTSSVDSKAILHALTSHRCNLIFNDVITLEWLNECDCIAQCRQYICTIQWQQIEVMILEMYHKSNKFQTCYNNLCKIELKSIYDKYIDHWFEENIMLGLQKGSIQLLENDDLIDYQSIDTYLLIEVIQKYSSELNLSRNTKKLLFEAKFIYCLRYLVGLNHWEVPAISTAIFFGTCRIENLSNEIQLYINNNNKGNNEIITTLLSLENELQKNFTIDTLINNYNVNELSISHLIAYFIQSKDCIINNMKEVDNIIQIFYYRRCQALILLGAYINQISGTINQLYINPTISTSIGQLLAIINYTEDSLPKIIDAKNKDKIIIWMDGLKLIMKVRSIICIKILDFSNDLDPEEINNFLIKIRNHQDHHMIGFPIIELEFIYHKLIDLINIQKVSNVVSKGSVFFQNQLFHDKDISYYLIKVAIEEAKEQQVTSDYLSRLLIYADICVQLRIAIEQKNWDLSSNGAIITSIDITTITNLTVKQCLVRYEEIKESFNDHMVPELPPNCLMNEFELVSREWGRRLLKNIFLNAFQKGTLNGSPLALQMDQLRTNYLEDAIKQYHELISLETSNNEISQDILLYVEAAKEMLQIRTELILLFNSYKRKCKFTQSNSLNTILENKQFISDSMNRAISRIEFIHKLPYQMTAEWIRIDKLVKNLKASFKVSALQNEIKLLISETIERKYISDALYIFNQFKQSMNSCTEQNILIDKLLVIYKEHEEALEKNNIMKDNFIISYTRENQILEYINHSVIILLHMLRANTLSLHDNYERNWKIDLNYINTPKIYILAKTITTGSFSKQQILRSACNLFLYPEVRTVLNSIEAEIEIEVSCKELKEVCSDSNYLSTGSIGNVMISPTAEEFTKYVFDRIENIIQPSEMMVEMKRKSVFGIALTDCLIVRNLRNVIHTNDYSLALNMLYKFLEIDEESLELIMQIISERKYRISSEAEKEFHFLATEVIDRLWQLSYAKSFVSDEMITGSPGAIVTFGVSCSSILQIQSLLRFMQEEFSEQSMAIKQLGESLIKLRLSVLGSLSNHKLDSSLSLIQESKHGKMKTNEELINITKSLSQYLSDDFIYDAIYEVDLLTLVNISWSETMRMYVEDCIAVMLDSLARCSFLDESIIRSITTESSVISAHCLYLKSAFEVESAITNGFYVTFNENGLEISCDDVQSLVTVYTNALKQNWKLDITSKKDYWWASLHFMISLFLKLIDLLEINNTTTCITVQPGTEHYGIVLPTISVILQQIVLLVGNIKKYSGLAKRQQLPSNIFHVRKQLELANLEHNKLQCLDNMINADKLICYCNDMHQMIIEVFPMYNIHPGKGDFDDVISIKSFNDDYYLYATQVRNTIEDIIVDTILGQKLKSLLLDIYAFRIEVTNHNWFNADLLSCKCIAWIPEFSSRNEDVMLFNNYLKYIQLRRSLEHSISSCDLPHFIGWSILGTKTEEIITNENVILIQSIVNDIKDKKDNESFLLKYPVLNTLIKIALKTIDLYQALQFHVWVNQSDRQLQLLDIPNIIDIAILLEEDIYTPYQQIELKPSSSRLNTAVSIYKVLSELKLLLNDTLLIEDYFLSYLKRFVTKLENELVIIQLEQLSIKYLIASKIFGRAGELIIPSTFIDSLNCIINNIESKGSCLLTAHCSVLRQTIQSVRIMLKLYQAHVEGDVLNLCKYTDLLIYLNHTEKKTTVFEEMKRSTDPNMLLKMTDMEYISIFDEHENNMLSNEVVYNTKADSNDYISTERSELEALFVTITSFSLSSVVNLRREIALYLPLLHKHAVFESCYAEYIIAIEDAPAAGSPGELEKKPIKYDRLELLQARFSKYKDLGVLKMWGKTNILAEMIESIYIIRKNQLTDDLSEVLIGTKQAERVQNLDLIYNKTMIIDCNWFAGKPKQIITEAIIWELDLAVKDLDQRMVITSMREALFAHNIPLDDYPFDISNVETEQLENALKLASNTTLICTKAKELQHACSIIIVFRKLIVEKNWTSMMTYLDNIKYLDLLNLDVLTTFEEYSAAIYVTNVSYGIELALEAYTTGYLGGVVGKASTCTRGEIIGELNLLNSDGLQKALSIFEMIDESKRSNAILEHMNTCHHLFEIRLEACKENWNYVYELSKTVLNQYQTTNELLLYPSSIVEFELAFDHAIYMISFIALNDAITSNGVYGMIGNIKLASLSIQYIQSACKKVIELNCLHPDVILMLKEAELLFRLRKAILLDQWLTIDHTKTYAKLLSSHFRFNNIEDPVTFRSEKLYMNPTSSVIDNQGMNNSLLQMIQIVPDVETIELILYDWIKIKESKQLAIDVEVEVSLIYSEMLYRQLVSTLLHALDSPGFTGEPGLINASQVTTRKLDTAIQSINKYPIEIYQSEDCRLFLRDATFLLKARRFRLNEMWAQLGSLLQKVDDIQMSNKNNQEMEAWERKIDHSERITEPVWQELNLLKYDRLFSISLASFADEMMREEELFSTTTVGITHTNTHTHTRSSSIINTTPKINRHGSIVSHRKNSMLVTKKDTFNDFYNTEEANNRVLRLKKIYNSTKILADSYKSKEYQRLVEAMHLALELRTFAQLHPHRSPSDIIHRAAVVKKGDIKEGISSYVSLLIYDISKLSNVLDFPLNLKVIRSELLRAKKYFDCTVGTFNIDEVKIEVITTAYQAALPSLEIMGTEENYQFMKLTDVMIQIRNCVLVYDIYRIKELIDENLNILKDSLVDDEIQRLLIDYENYHAAELIEAGLRTGRYLNVLIIAKMAEHYDIRMNAATSQFLLENQQQQQQQQLQKVDMHTNNKEEEDSEIDVAMNYPVVPLVTMKSVRKRSSHRHITFSEAMKYQLKHPPSTTSGSCLSTSSTSLVVKEVKEVLSRSVNDVVIEGDNEEEEDEDVPEDLESYEFVNKVIDSVSTLNRAIRIANQLSIKTPKLEFYLETAQLILKLREGIVTDDWTTVREILKVQSDQQSNLPRNQISTAALEEIKAIQEGLSYKVCMEKIKHALVQGTISGVPHDIDYDNIDYKILDQAIQSGREVKFVDPSALFILEFAKKLYNIRYYLYEDIWRNSTRKNRTNSILSTIDIAIKANTKINRCSVEDALEDMLVYQSEHLAKLQTFLGISTVTTTTNSSSNNNSTTTNSNSSTTSSSSNISSSSSAVNKPQECEEDQNAAIIKQNNTPIWIQDIWDSILFAQKEVTLVLQAIQYLHLVTNLKDEVCNIPDVIVRYIENKNRMYNSYYDEVKRFKVLDITEIDKCYDISGQINQDPYNIVSLQTVVQSVREYLNSIPYGTSEDLLKLLNTAVLLLDFRSFLGYNSNVSTLMLEDLLFKAKNLLKQEVIAPLDGMKELKAFISIATKCMYLHNHLREMILSESTTGPLDQLSCLNINIDSMKNSQDIRKLIDYSLHNDDNWIDETISFLARAGRELSLGLLDFYVEARVIDKLRSLLRSNRWLEVGLVLQQHKAHTKKWLHGIKEFIHIEHAYNFYCIQTNMNKLLNSFQGNENLKYKDTIIFKSDLDSFEKVFKELQELLNYKSDLLKPKSLSEAIVSNDKINNMINNSTSDIFSKSYSSNIVFLASKALWRLLKALIQKNWFVKHSIHDNPLQTIPGTVATIDPLLFRFFGIGDSNYIDNIDNREHFNDIILLTKPATVSGTAIIHSKENQHSIEHDISETVFSVLVSVNWEIFPIHIRLFFNQVRNCLIDYYIQSDLSYYCKKGAATVDHAGNLIISSLYYKLFQLSMLDIQKIHDLSNSLCISFSFHDDTIKWILASRIICQCRSAVVENDMEALINLLEQLGYLRSSGTTSFYNPNYYLIHNELQAYENYVKGYIAENIVKECIFYLMQSSNNQSYESILNHSTIVDVLELAKAPLSSLQINQYYIEMMRFIYLLKDIIYACMSGMETKLTSKLQELSNCWIEKYQNEIDASMHRAHISLASQLLIKVCRYYCYSDLFQMKYQISTDMQLTHDKQVTQLFSTLATSSSSKKYAAFAMKCKLLSSNNNNFMNIEAEDLTIEIMKSICELIYFIEEKHTSINTLSTSAMYYMIMKDNKSTTTKTSHTNQVPYYSYIKLKKLLDKITESYIINEPKWVLCLLIIIYYLRKEEEAIIFQRNPNNFQVNNFENNNIDDDDIEMIYAMELTSITQINISYELSNFLKEINLEKIVLLEYIRNNNQHNLKLTNNNNNNSNKLDIEQILNHNIICNSNSLFMDHSPNMIIITKYLTSIRNIYHSQNINSNIETKELSNVSLNKNIIFAFYPNIKENTILWNYLYSLYEMIDITNKQLQH